MNEASQHQDGKSQEVQAFQSLWQAFVITGQAAKASDPAKRTLDHPAARPQDKALFEIRQLDDDKLDALLSRRLGGWSPV